jgi:2-octaprenyl-6-methoxyphenol hydroxylase
MSEGQFNTLLYHHMPHYGRIGANGPRRAYPLKFQHAKKYYAPRIALISETVHAIHPIAGQGLNVGMRDVAVLTKLLIEARDLGLDIGVETLLARYGAMRMPDSAAMSVATHGLDKLFSNDFSTIAALRRTGLQLVARLPPVKKFFMRYAMGLTHRIAA